MPDAITGATVTAPTPPATPATPAPPAGGGQLVTTDTPTIDPELLNRPDALDKDMFLQLLVAQLKYQNPLDPMDSTQFMAQTAQFTTVEKLTELTEQLGESLANDRLGTATGMIGRDVTFTRLDGNTATATVDGVRFEPLGPVLLLSGGEEVGMADVVSVSQRA